jgi:hypothetical protein
MTEFDLLDEPKMRELQEAEFAARLAEARARLAEAQARSMRARIDLFERRNELLSIRAADPAVDRDAA